MSVDADALFVAVDVGTGGARASAFDARATMVAEVRCPYATSVPAPGRAEQDATAWTREAANALAGLGRRIDPARVVAIGLTGQTPTVVPVDAELRPLGPGLLYRDNRATAEAQELVARTGACALHARTGHVPSAFHVGPKLLWLRRHEPDVLARTRWFLQPRDLVAHLLTGVVATDESHAAATALLDLRRGGWAGDLVRAAGVDLAQLPAVLAPWAVVGGVTPAMAAATGLRPGTPVAIGAGDSQCAAYGAGVVESGPVSEMAGSSSCINSVVLQPVGDLRVTHYRHAVPDRFTTELGVNTTGAAIRWAVGSFGFGSHERLDAEALVGRRRVLDAEGEDARESAPFFDPRLGDGERDDPAARGALSGLREVHDRSAIAFAVLEGVAAAVGRRVDVLRAAGCAVTEVRAAGGGARSSVLGQVKADVLGVPVVHFDLDTAALGAAMIGARAAGHADAARSALDAALYRSRRFEPEAEGVAAAHARAAARTEGS